MESTTNPASAFLTTAEARAIACMSRPSFDRAVEAGRLTPAFRLPGRTGARLFARTDVEAFAAERAAS